MSAEEVDYLIEQFRKIIIASTNVNWKAGTDLHQQQSHIRATLLSRLIHLKQMRKDRTLVQNGKVVDPFDLAKVDTGDTGVR